ARSTWALEILVEEGFRIDSSIFPVYHDRYGIPNARVEPHQIETPAGPVWEFPVSVRRVGGVNWPVSGGGYFRLYPLAWTLQSLKQINRSRPFVFYVHPWELDPGQPQLAVASRMSRWRHYVNLGSTEQKLAALLQRFRFAPLGEVIADLENAGSRADASVNDRQRTAAGPQG
ncbi:MAG: DUF3473 domain-containing protein, partial [Planctomycetes bacterium]|nr:DUF3473 domain-containing protein [Planctomycetota bacterium]